MALLLSAPVAAVQVWGTLLRLASLPETPPSEDEGLYVIGSALDAIIDVMAIAWLWLIVAILLAVVWFVTRPKAAGAAGWEVSG